MNIVILRGVLSRAPQVRELPSGDRLGAFEVTTPQVDGPAQSVPVVWFDVPERALALAAGTEVVVTGAVRRRFYRSPAGTASRTEVVATRVLPATQRTRVAGAIDAAVAALTQEVAAA